MFKKISIVAVVAFLGFTSLTNAKADKITVCHVTGSESNPIVEITVSMKALATHLAHGDFLIPLGDVDCFGNGGGPLPE